MSKTTIRDVAKESGYSIATVSKALNGVNVVRPETKKKIEAVATRLHYVPNLMGKQLKSGQTKMIGFYTKSVAGPYFSNLVEAIAREAEKNNYGVNVFIATDKQIVLNSIMGNIVDGIIGFEDLITEDDLRAMEHEKIAAVFVDRNIASETMGSVVFDSYKKGYEAAEYLLRLGHKKIAFIAGFKGVYDSDERQRGYKDAIEKHGLIYDTALILQGSFEEEGSYNAVRSFMRIHSSEIPTAFLAGNDLSAIGAIKALKIMGYDVPKDISVMGFDDIEVLEYFRPGLTTIHNPIARQGALAVDHLLKLIHGQESGKFYQLQGELVIRNSVSVPKY